MKFQVSSTKLLQQMQALGRVISVKNSLQILETVLFDLNGNQLTLTASDSETTMRTIVEVEGEGQGKVAFEAKRLLDTLKEFPEQPLTFEINDQNFGLNIVSSNGNYSFVGINGAEYPEMTLTMEGAAGFSISATTLLGAINKTIFCTAATEDFRPVMNGIFFDLKPENITLVATDAHRLVRYINTSASVSEPANFILPKKPANLLRNVLPKEQGDVQVNFTDKNVCFTFGQTIIVCRQIEGKFPNYNAVIPQNNTNKITADRQTILNAIRRVSVFGAAAGLIKLSLSENSINISAQDIDFSTSAEETIECSYEGQPMNIGFKAPFLIEILAAVLSDEVIIELADPSRAGLILPFENEENEDIVMLLMPMLLND